MRRLGPSFPESVLRGKRCRRVRPRALSQVYLEGSVVGEDLLKPEKVRGAPSATAAEIMYMTRSVADG